MWGIMNASFPALIGGGGGLTAWVSSLPPVLIFFSGVGGMAIGLMISNEIAARSIQKRLSAQKLEVDEPKHPESQEGTSASRNQELADLMSANIRRDTGILPRCIEVGEPYIDWPGLLNIDPYIDFRFDVLSSSVFTLAIGKTSTGHIRYQNAESINAVLERTPEITVPIEQLERAVWRRITFRQWLSDTVMSVMRSSDGGKEITFTFSGVSISVESKLPDGSEGPTCRLPLPDACRVRMPTHQELSTS